MLGHAEVIFPPEALKAPGVVPGLCSVTAGLWKIVKTHGSMTDPPPCW